jgi:hypothetical protein
MNLLLHLFYIAHLPSLQATLFIFFASHHFRDVEWVTRRYTFYETHREIPKEQSTDTLPYKDSFLNSRTLKWNIVDNR